MIVYFDTSALIPLFTDEPGSEVANFLWDEADRKVSARVVYVEARAALATAERQHRFETGTYPEVLASFEEAHDEIDLLEITDELMRSAGELAERHALRGFDATHLAAAIAAADDDLVLAAGDRALIAAAENVGLQVAVVG